MYKDHAYRRHIHPNNLISFRVVVKETDLLVSALKDLSEQTKDIVHTYRRHLEEYIRSRPEFLLSLTPYPEDPFAPQVIREMISATRMFGVGPMAAVAGTIADLVGKGLLLYSDEVIVENGGDIFLKIARPANVSIFAGDSPLSNKVGLVIQPEQMPTGVCTSSGTVGHSLSLGIADAVCIVARSASIADAAATALGNKITSKVHLKREIESLREFEAIMGAIVIIGKTMATWGEIKLREISGKFNSEA
jgi:ApbE superfamily uncharacterized protein (UPF0280 family)